MKIFLIILSLIKFLVCQVKVHLKGHVVLALEIFSRNPVILWTLFTITSRFLFEYKPDLMAKLEEDHVGGGCWLSLYQCLRGEGNPS